MPQYPASSFESAVGGFLQGYSTVRDMRRQNAEDARREREARAAERMRQITLENEGYKEEAVPAAPEPRRNFMQSIGHTLRGRPEPEQDTRLVKVGPSRAERIAEAQREFQRTMQDDEQAAALERDAARQAFEATQGDLTRQTTLAQAGIYAGQSRAANARADAEAEREARDRFLSDLFWSTDGSGRAMNQRVINHPGLLAQAQRFRIGAHEYDAAARRFRGGEELRRATVQSRTTEKAEAPRVRRSEGSNTGTSGIAQQQQAWDRAAAALRAQGKEPAQVIGPRP